MQEPTQTSPATGRDREVELSADQFRLLLDHLREIIYTVDEDGCLSWASQAWEQSLRCDPKEAIGKPFVDLLHPDDRETWRAMFDSNRAVEDLPQPIEYRVADSSGAWRHHQGDGVWVPDANGEGRLFMGSAEDVTLRKRAEQQQTQSETLRNIGSLAGGVAHDIGNLLTPMLGFSQLLRDHPSNEELVVEFVDIVDTNLNKLDHLTRQLLLFGRKDGADFYPMDLRAKLGEVVERLPCQLPAGIEFHVSLNLPADRDLLLRGEPSQIDEILDQLVCNAVDAMPDGGHLRLDAVLFSPETGFTPTGPNEESTWIRLRLEDSGQGIPEDVRAHIFEPFFTTKDKGKGKGLGLTTVAKLVEDHRGFVDLETHPGGGTTFDVYLPLYDPAEPRRSMFADEQS